MRIVTSIPYLNTAASIGTTSTTSHIPRLTEHQNSTAAAAAANLASKRFKMLRLKKDNTNSELGIVISKKRNPQKGTSGYIIAHIEPDGLVER